MKKTWMKNTVVMLLALAMVCGVCFVAGENTAQAAGWYTDIPIITHFGADAIDLDAYYTGDGSLPSASTRSYAVTAGGTVLTVSTDGVVESLKNGAATVKVTRTYQNAEGTDVTDYQNLALTVKVVVTLSLPSTAEVLRNADLDLTAESGFNSAPTGDTLTWKSSAPSVATVNSATGVVHGLSGGKTVVSATSKISGAVAKCTVSVVAPSITVSAPNPATITSLGGTATITAELNKRGQTMGDACEWYSTNENVATVSPGATSFSASGYSSTTITAVASGTAKIYCKSTETGFENIYAYKTITVGSGGGGGSVVTTDGLTISTDETRLGKGSVATLWINVENPVPLTSGNYAGYALAKVTRSTRRVYLEGWDLHDTTSVYYVALDGAGNADLSVLPQYNGTVTLTVSATGVKSRTITYTVTGYPTLPQGGQDFTLIYVLGACCLAAAAAWVILYAKKKQNNFVA